MLFFYNKRCWLLLKNDMVQYLHHSFVILLLIQEHFIAGTNKLLPMNIPVLDIRKK